MIRLPFVLAVALAATACSHTAPPRAPSAQPNVSVLAQRFVLPELERERTLRLYLPPSYAAQPGRRYPVIYMHDGQNLFDDATSYAGEWGVDETLNTLARTHGFEAIAVGIDNGGDKRMTELNPWDHPRFGPGEGAAYLRFIVEVVKPWIDGHYRTDPRREATAVMGSSMGGLISHAAIQRYPQVFGKAGVFSPAYWTAEPYIFDLAQQQPLPTDARIALTMGGGEGAEAVAAAARMQQVLGVHPAASQFTLVPEHAHNEAAWRAQFGPVVQWLFQLSPKTP